MSKELERVREEIAEWLENYSPKHNTTSSGWVIIPEVAKERYREDADHLIANVKGLCIESDNQELPEVEEDNPFIRLDEQAKMLQSNFRRVIK